MMTGISHSFSLSRAAQWGCNIQVSEAFHIISVAERSEISTLQHKVTNLPD